MRKRTDFSVQKAYMQEELEKLREIVIDCGLTEELKWGVPCYTFQNNNIVLIHGFKEYCAINFFKGVLLSDAEGILIQQTEKRFGSLDILVNNAGIQYTANVEDFPADKWESIIAINLSSAFYTSHHALPGMKKRNWGRIINIASVHGLVGSIQKSAYVAAKHGIVGLTKVTALENATTGITCNAICPGWVLTPLVQKQVDARAAAEGVDNAEATRRLLGEKQPSLQFTTPAELGALTVFLCADAAINVRGQAWAVDGGWTAQ